MSDKYHKPWQDAAHYTQHLIRPYYICLSIRHLFAVDFTFELFWGFARIWKVHIHNVQILLWKVNRVETVYCFAYPTDKEESHAETTDTRTESRASSRSSGGRGSRQKGRRRGGKKSVKVKEEMAPIEEKSVSQSSKSTARYTEQVFPWISTKVLTLWMLGNFLKIDYMLSAF